MDCASVDGKLSVVCASVNDEMGVVFGVVCASDDEMGVVLDTVREPVELLASVVNVNPVTDGG